MGIGLTLALVVGASLETAFAQELFRVRPLFSVTQVYDSNMFSSAPAHADFISRVSPGVDTEYRSRLMQLHSRYTLDMEHFARRPALTTADGRHAAAADLRYAPSRRVTVTLDAGFTRTHTPGELSPVAGLTFGRAAAERIEARPTIVREFGARTSGSIGYTFTADRLTGAGSMRAHGAVLGVDRQISRRDVVNIDYDVRRFAFAPRRDSTAHVVRVGWEHPLTRRADVTFRGGTGVVDGVVNPDVLASIRQRTRSVDLAFTYARTQTTVIGVTGVVDADSITASASSTLRPGLEIRVAPGVSRTRQDSRSTRAWQLSITTDRRIHDRLLLRLSYEASAQRGRLVTGDAADTGPRHQVQAGLLLQPVIRHRN